MLGLFLQRLDVRICDHLTCHARALTCVFSPQVCFGAVQRSVLAHVQSGHPGPHLLPSRPLCGAHSVVQCHHEYPLMEKHLPSGSVPSPAASVTEPLPALFLRPLRSLHCDSSAGTSCLCRAPYRVTHGHFLMDLETSTAVTPAGCGVGTPDPWLVGSFGWWWFLGGKQKRRYPFAHKSLCFQSLSKLRVI